MVGAVEVLSSRLLKMAVSDLNLQDIIYASFENLSLTKKGGMCPLGPPGYVDSVTGLILRIFDDVSTS